MDVAWAFLGREVLPISSHFIWRDVPKGQHPKEWGRGKLRQLRAHIYL